jgi:transposase-like protein
MHRVREAMTAGGGDPFSGIVVADEAWIGGKPANRHGHKRGQGGQGNTDKTPVVSLVHVETGEIRSKVVANVSGKTLRRVIAEQVTMSETTLHTDTAGQYTTFSTELAGHESVNHHAGEYVRGGVSTNKVENYFSQLKRSIDGTHHHVSPEHLHRYLAEFDFRHSTHELTDSARMGLLMGRAAGRRLMYSVSPAGA